MSSINFITVKETAERLGVTAAYVRELLNRGQYDRSIKLKGKKVGREWRVDPKSVDAFLGISNEDELYKKDLKIRELEMKIMMYEKQFSTCKDVMNTMNNILYA